MRAKGFISDRYDLTFHVVDQVEAVLPYLAQLEAPTDAV
jgi:hypothetical protein